MKSKICIVEARYYEDVSDYLLSGARSYFEQTESDIHVVTVPGALEIPPAIAILEKTGRYDAYIALGCVIRGETSHYDIVAGESARGLMDLGVQYKVVIGNGILTCENKEQALERADPRLKNKGGEAAAAAITLLNLSGAGS